MININLLILSATSREEPVYRRLKIGSYRPNVWTPPVKQVNQ